MSAFALAGTMVGTLSKVSSLLVAVGILLTGHGLQLTLLPVHALGAGWTPSAIGITGSAYFVGFVAGCIVMPGVVAGVGHIRSFMVMAAVAAVALLGAGLLTNFWAWLLFRGATGFALAGLYMVIESWLGDVTPRESRGTVLAFYSVICLAGLAVGQLLMGLDQDAGPPLFLAAGLLLSLAIIPVGLTRVGSPQPIPAMEFRMSGLLRASRVSVVCAGIAGLVTSAFWALGPLLAGALGIDPAYTGLLMSLGIAGGAACHLPVGRLSDRFDRRIVIASLAGAGAVFGAVAAVYAPSNPLLVYAAFFLIGAASMPLYSLCIALASDQSDMTLVEITSSVLLINGVGSVVGPVIVSIAIGSFGPRAYFVYCAVCFVCAALWPVYRLIVTERQAEHGGASMLPRTTQAIAGFAQEDGAS